MGVVVLGYREETKVFRIAEQVDRIGLGIL